MHSTRVGIIGGGISGPVMAMFLKYKGYQPIIYERSMSVKDRGLGIGYVVFYNLYVDPSILSMSGHDQMDFIHYQKSRDCSSISMAFPVRNGSSTLLCRKTWDTLAACPFLQGTKASTVMALWRYVDMIYKRNSSSSLRIWGLR